MISTATPANTKTALAVGRQEKDYGGGNDDPSGEQQQKSRKLHEPSPRRPLCPPFGGKERRAQAYRQYHTR